MGNHTLMMHWGWLQGQRRLPTGYRRVEYLESSGAQWIDTGVAVNSSYGFDLDWQGIAFVNHEIFGGGSTWSVGLGIATRAGGSVGFIIGTTSDVGGQLAFPTTRNIYSVHDNTVYVNGVQHGSSLTSNINNSKTLWIFRHSGTNANTSAYRCFSCRLYDDIGTKIRDFVPCVRNADSKPGMYDLCGSICPLTGTPFYVNSGTGADFTWGELQ